MVIKISNLLTFIYHSTFFHNFATSNKTMKKKYLHPESKFIKVDAELPIAFSKSGPGNDNEDPATKMRGDLESDDEW